MSALSTLMREFRFAARNLSKAPVFTAVAVLTLALGIGASTAMFTVVDSVILRPLAYPESGSLVAAWERIRFMGFDPIGPNPRHAEIWQERSAAFQQLTFLIYRSFGVTGGNADPGAHPRLTPTVIALPNFFDTLRVRPLFGRTFLPEDGIEGHDHIVVLTWQLWQSMFHGDSAVIGKTIVADNTPCQVVGVLPAGFHFPNSNALRAFHSHQPVSGAEEPEMFLPAVMDYSKMEWNGNYGNWVTLARLKPGVSIRHAEAQINAIQARIALEMPQGDHRPDSMRASLEPMQEAVVGGSRAGLTLLLAAVLGLMLIGCLNLANAQLARILSRRRDAAVRAAFGASKWQVVAAPLAENLLLAAAGGAGGVCLGYAALTILRTQTAIDIPRLAEIRLNPAVLAFAFLSMLAAALISGLLPSLRMALADPNAALHGFGNRSFGSRQGSGLQAILIAAQVFGCTVLLLVTGLFARSLFHLLSEDKVSTPRTPQLPRSA